MALGILSAVKPDAFYLAVQSRDIKVLTKLPGIGKKTAERLLLELKDKVGPVAAESGDSFGEAVAAGGSGAVAGEAIEGLASLGYGNSEIMPVIKKIEGAETKTSEEILKHDSNYRMGDFCISSDSFKSGSAQCCRDGSVPSDDDPACDPGIPDAV